MQLFSGFTASINEQIISLERAEQVRVTANEAGLMNCEAKRAKRFYGEARTNKKGKSMKLKTKITSAAFFSLFFIFIPLSASAIEIDELIRHIDRLWRGETSQAHMTMTVKTQRYKRSMSMEAWSRGKDYSLVVIRKPIKDKGIATLKVKDNIWNYLPKINRVTKVPSSMMSGSWMGSHFTNDDLVKESTFEDDFASHISFEGKRNGVAIYEITSIPKEDAAVVWGKVIMQIEQKTLAPYRALYYDEEGLLVRTMTFDQPRIIDERTVPMRLTLQPEDKPEESTVIIYNDIVLNVPIADSFFSLQNLQRRR